MHFTAYRWFSKIFSAVQQNCFSRINTCSPSQFMHPHAGTELLTSVKDLSFNIKIYFPLGTTLEVNLKRKQKNLQRLQNIVRVLIFLKKNYIPLKYSA